MLDGKLYRQYLAQYVAEAVQNSDGTTRGAGEYLDNLQIGGGLFMRHRLEKQRALEEARAAFTRNRHWPLEIVISQLGIEIPGLSK